MAVIDVALKGCISSIALSAIRGVSASKGPEQRRHNCSIQRSNRLNASRTTVIYLPVMLPDYYSAPALTVMYTAEGQMARMLSSVEVLVLIVQHLTLDP